MIAHAKKIKIFTGNSHPELAKEIADLLGIPLGNAKVSTFSDGEISVDINETVRGVDVFIVQSTSSPVNNNLMELLIMIDAFKRASAGRITAVIPYYGYARQDRIIQCNTFSDKAAWFFVKSCGFNIIFQNVGRIIRIYSKIKSLYYLNTES